MDNNLKNNFHSACPDFLGEGNLFDWGNYFSKTKLSIQKQKRFLRNDAIVLILPNPDYGISGVES
jgi:hypothetical protein